MELLVVLLKLAYIAAILAIAGGMLVSFVGLTNNTKSGNSFQAMNPAILFMPRLLNEIGNRHRRRFLGLWLASVIVTTIYWYAERYT